MGPISIFFCTQWKRRLSLGQALFACFNFPTCIRPPQPATRTAQLVPSCIVVFDVRTACNQEMGEGKGAMSYVAQGPTSMHGMGLVGVVDAAREESAIGSLQ